MYVTEEGILIYRSEVPAKAELPIDVILSEIVKLLNVKQPLNASSPILVTEVGIVIEAKLLHCLKAALPIDVTLEAINTLD